ncbi:unnamed protein product [Amoebophrya sp. A25]|nr:unnamed protein product [Amoebophrya sp. A25]|eukprot:GSA25T00014336001.1
MLALACCQFMQSSSQLSRGRPAQESDENLGAKSEDSLVLDDHVVTARSPSSLYRHSTPDDDGKTTQGFRTRNLPTYGTCTCRGSRAAVTWRVVGSSQTRVREHYKSNYKRSTMTATLRCLFLRMIVPLFSVFCSILTDIAGNPLGPIMPFFVEAKRRSAPLRYVAARERKQAVAPPSVACSTSPPADFVDDRTQQTAGSSSSGTGSAIIGNNSTSPRPHWSWWGSHDQSEEPGGPDLGKVLFSNTTGWSNLGEPPHIDPSNLVKEERQTDARKATSQRIVGLRSRAAQSFISSFAGPCGSSGNNGGVDARTSCSSCSASAASTATLSQGGTATASMSASSTGSALIRDTAHQLASEWGMRLATVAKPSGMAMRGPLMHPHCSSSSFSSMHFFSPVVNAADTFISRVIAAERQRQAESSERERTLGEAIDNPTTETREDEKKGEKADLQAEGESGYPKMVASTYNHAHAALTREVDATCDFSTLSTERGAPQTCGVAASYFAKAEKNSPSRIGSVVNVKARPFGVQPEDQDHRDDVGDHVIGNYRLVRPASGKFPAETAESMEDLASIFPPHASQATAELEVGSSMSSPFSGNDENAVTQRGGFLRLSRIAQLRYNNDTSEMLCCHINEVDSLTAGGENFPVESVRWNQLGAVPSPDTSQGKMSSDYSTAASSSASARSFSKDEAARVQPGNLENRSPSTSISCLAESLDGSEDVVGRAEDHDHQDSGGRSLTKLGQLMKRGNGDTSSAGISTKLQVEQDQSGSMVLSGEQPIVNHMSWKYNGDVEGDYHVGWSGHGLARTIEHSPQDAAKIARKTSENSSRLNPLHLANGYNAFSNDDNMCLHNGDAARPTTSCSSKNLVSDQFRSQPSCNDEPEKLPAFFETTSCRCASVVEKSIGPSDPQSRWEMSPKKAPGNEVAGRKKGCFFEGGSQNRHLQLRPLPDESDADILSPEPSSQPLLQRSLSTPTAQQTALALRRRRAQTEQLQRSVSHDADGVTTYVSRSAPVSPAMGHVPTMVQEWENRIGTTKGVPDAPRQWSI